MSKPANCSILLDESTNLESLSYRGLQQIAQDFELPGTLKKPVMVAMLQAKREGDDEMVRKIVNENRRHRAPKPGTSAKADKKASTASKRRGPGRPPREKSPGGVPEKRAKGGHALAANDQALFKDTMLEKMSSTQLHPTQPLLRALLGTTPSHDTASSLLQTAVSKIQHTDNSLPNLTFLNRAQSLQQNLQSVAMYHSSYAEQNPYYQYTYPPNAHNGNRCHSSGAKHDNFPRQPYPPNLNATGFNDNQAVCHNGQFVPGNANSAETIIPDMVVYDNQSNFTQLRGQYEIPSKYARGSFAGGGELCANMASGNAAGQEAWNRSNSFHFANAQEHTTVRRLFAARQRQFLPPAVKPGFKDSGGFLISNAYEFSRINNININFRNSSQVYDLSVPKPYSSQDTAKLGTAVDGIYQGGSANYCEHYQPPFAGSLQDVAYTQTNNNALGQQGPQEQHGQEGPLSVEPDCQTYAALVNARPPPPAYQSPQSLRRSQQAAFEMSSRTKCAPMVLKFTPSEKMPCSLEYLFNLRRELFAESDERGRALFERPNMATSTSTTDFYRYPLISSRTYASCSGSEATESSPEDPECYDVEVSGRPSNGDQAIGTGNIETNSWVANQTAETSPYPEQGDRNQHCLPMLYEFLEATGEMDQFHNMDAASACVANLAPTAMSTPTEAMQNTHSLELTPHQHHPNSSVPAMECTAVTPIANMVGRHYNGDPGLVRCKFAWNGCQQIYPAQQLQFHEQGCLHLMIRCPMDFCPWGGRLGRLADHICDVGGHKNEVVCGEKQTFSFDLTMLCEKSCLHFAQNCFTRLFVVTVMFRGFQAHAFLQEVATYTAEETKPPSAKGYLEIVGKDGYPYSWNGLIAPIQVSLANMMRAGQCLTIHIGDITVDENNRVRLYEMITL